MDEVAVGARLKLARESAGLSLAAMAGRTHYSRGYLANVENGRKRATPEIVLAYERVLGGDDVERRALLTGLAASVVAPAVMAEALSGAFTAALAGRVSVDEWQHRAEQYGRDYMSLGATDLSNRLVADLVQLQQYTDDPHVWAVAGRLMTVFGKTLPANEGRRGAVAWYRLAAVAADRSGDLATRVWVRGRAALALAYEAAAPGVAGSLAARALALSDRPSLGRLNALVARAHLAGQAGDRNTAIAVMEQAQRLFDRVGSSDHVSDFAVPEWRMETFRSMLLSRLGDPRAEKAQEAADRARPSELARFATHIELHRGLLMARQGDSTGGVTYAREALGRLPVERQSLSLRLMMNEITRTAA